MGMISGIILFVVFLLLAFIHLYWGFGGKWGAGAAVPTRRGSDKRTLNPGLFGCITVSLGLLAFGLFTLIKAGMIVSHLPSWLLNYGLWIISVIFLLRAIGEFTYVGFFKKVRDTKFAKYDTMFYTPLCLLIATLAVILQLSY